MEQIKIFKFNEKYYLAFKEDQSDFAVAKILGVNIETYCQNIENICGKTFGCEIYFDNKEDVQKAIDYVESILTLNKICE